MPHLKNSLRFFSFGVVVLTLLLAGCSSSKSRVGGVLNLDTDLKLQFDVDGNINPDENRRPSPLFVRMYQLKSPTAFNKADFIDLYERDEEMIGGDLVKKQTLRPLAPGEIREERFVLQPGTTHVALYAEFSQYRDSKYKVVFAVTENNVFRNAATVKISGTNISLVKK